MKKQTIITKTVSLFLAIAILVSSCASTTMIQSVPTGAKIYINGEPAGTTPYSYSDTKISGTATTVKLEKEGYESMNTTFSRNEKADAGAIIGGIFFLFPFIWTMKYNPTHTYELKPLAEISEKSINVNAPQNSKSKEERLREIKRLLDDKILTQEEFEKEKIKILEEDDK